MSLLSRRGSRSNRVPRISQRVFDLALAQEALGLVHRIVSDISLLKSRLVQRRGQIDRISADPLQSKSRDRFRLEDEARETRNDLRKVIDELHSVGVVLLDPIRGEVGFPTIVNGSLAYLVYRAENEGISFWRYRDQARLRPIPDHWRGLTTVSTEIEEEGLVV